MCPNFLVRCHTITVPSQPSRSQLPVAFVCDLCRNSFLTVLQISSATAAYFSASTLPARNSLLIQYPHPSFRITPTEEAISRISDSWQIPFPNLMSMPASFRLTGANLFLMICTDIPIPVACVSRVHYFQRMFDMLS